MQTRLEGVPTLFKKKKKKKITLKRVLIALFSLVILYFAMYLIVVPERANKPALSGSSPLVIAQRGGAELSPENTLIAFERAVKLGVDMIHFNIRMSQDGHLVVIHDDTVDRTTNGEGKVAELTLEQLRAFDAAHRFRDIRGNFIYRNQGVRIPTVEEVFRQFPDTRMMIEMKEERSMPAGEMEEKLYQLINKYKMDNKVVVYSADDKMMQHFRDQSSGKIAVGAGKQEITGFSVLHKLFLNRLYRPKSDAIIVPPSSGGINHTDRRLIEGAHRLNMKVIFWDIKDEQTMIRLLGRGADGIITVRPDLLIRVLNDLESQR